MAGSYNKITVVGNLGRDPESRQMQNGKSVVSFSVATSESWKNNDGERQERTQWHRIVIFNEPVGDIAMKYLKKGSKALIEGQMEYRKFQDKDGNEREVSEIVLRPFNGVLQLMDGRPNDGGGERESRGDERREARGNGNGNGGGRSGGYGDRGGNGRSGGYSGGRDSGRGGGGGRSGGGGWDSKPDPKNADLDDDIPF